VDDGQSEGAEGSEGSDELVGADPGAEPVPAPRNPRQVRARRRRRRRQIGTLIFLVVAAAVFAAAYFALSGNDDSSDDATSTTAPIGAATTTTVAFSGSYTATTGINVRQGAGTSFPVVATVETGRPMTVVCVVDGEPVNAPTGANAQWLRITAPAPGGYVSAAFVSVGDDLNSKKIPACPAA
jgi:hypothetical protein